MHPIDTLLRIATRAGHRHAAVMYLRRCIAECNRAHDGATRARCLRAIHVLRAAG